MSIKEMAIQTIENLPNDAGFDEILQTLFIKAKFENGLKDVELGKGISNEEAKKRLEKWLK